MITTFDQIKKKNSKSWCISIYTDTAKEALSKTKVAEQLVKQLRRAENHERLEMVFEVLQALAENGKAPFVLGGQRETGNWHFPYMLGPESTMGTC